MLHFENEWRAEGGKAKSTISNFGAKCQVIMYLKTSVLKHCLLHCRFYLLFLQKSIIALTLTFFFSLKKIHAIVGNTDLDQEAMGRSPL